MTKSRKQEAFDWNGLLFVIVMGAIFVAAIVLAFASGSFGSIKLHP